MDNNDREFSEADSSAESGSEEFFHDSVDGRKETADFSNGQNNDTGSKKRPRPDLVLDLRNVPPIACAVKSDDESSEKLSAVIEQPEEHIGQDTTLEEADESHRNPELEFSLFTIFRLFFFILCHTCKVGKMTCPSFTSNRKKTKLSSYRLTQLLIILWQQSSARADKKTAGSYNRFAATTESRGETVEKRARRVRAPPREKRYPSGRRSHSCSPSRGGSLRSRVAAFE